MSIAWIFNLLYVLHSISTLLELVACNKGAHSNMQVQTPSFFGSDKSSRSHFVCLSVCPGQVCLEQSISRSESNQRAIRALKSESYSRSLKYCVLLSEEFKLHSTARALRFHKVEVPRVPSKKCPIRASMSSLHFERYP